MPRCEAKGRIEADVVHRPWHRLEPDHSCALLFQPLHTVGDDHLADSLALIVGVDSQRPHPPLDARPMDHVERRDSVTRIAPDHRAILRVRDRELPHCRIQVRYPNANHSVFAVTLGECLAEHRVKRRNLAHTDTLGCLRHPRMPPVARERHHAPAPAALSTLSSASRGRTLEGRSVAIGSTSSLTPMASPSLSVTTEQPRPASE